MKGVRPITQAEAMLCIKEFRGRYAARDRALFLLQFYTGRRISQLLALRVKDVLNKPKPEQYQNLVHPLEGADGAEKNDAHRPIASKSGGCGEVVDRIYFERKHVKGRISGQAVQLHQRARFALNDWVLELRARGYLQGGNYLFQSQQGPDCALSRSRAYRIYRAVFDRLGLDGPLGTHSLRKAFASEMYDTFRGDLIKTQRALDHVKIDSTTAYLGFRQEEVDEAIGAMPDIGGGD